MDWGRVHLAASLLGFVLAAVGFLAGIRSALWIGVALIVLAQAALIIYALREGVDDDDDDVSGFT